MVFSNLFVASEDDLKRKIVDLKKQLREAEVALEGVEGDGKVEPKGSDNGSTDVDESTRTFGKNGVSSSMSELSTVGASALAFIPRANLCIREWGEMHHQTSHH